MTTRCLICGHDNLCKACVWCHALDGEFYPCCEGQCVTTEDELRDIPYEDLIERILAAASVREWEARPYKEVGDLELSVRAENMLSAAGITTLGALAKLTTVELLRMPHSNKRMVKEVSAAIEKLKTAGL